MKEGLIFSTQRQVSHSEDDFSSPVDPDRSDPVDYCSTSSDDDEVSPDTVSLGPSLASAALERDNNPARAGTSKRVREGEFHQIESVSSNQVDVNTRDKERLESKLDQNRVKEKPDEDTLDDGLINLLDEQIDEDRVDVKQNYEILDNKLDKDGLKNKQYVDRLESKAEKDRIDINIDNDTLEVKLDTDILDGKLCEDKLGSIEKLSKQAQPTDENNQELIELNVCQTGYEIEKQRSFKKSRVTSNLDNILVTPDNTVLKTEDPFNAKEFESFGSSLDQVDAAERDLNFADSNYSDYTVGGATVETFDLSLGLSHQLTEDTHSSTLSTSIDRLQVNQSLLNSTDSGFETLTFSGRDISSIYDTTDGDTSSEQEDNVTNFSSDVVERLVVPVSSTKLSYRVNKYLDTKSSLADNTDGEINSEQKDYVAQISSDFLERLVIPVTPTKASYRIDELVEIKSDQSDIESKISGQLVIDNSFEKDQLTNDSATKYNCHSVSSKSTHLSVNAVISPSVGLNIPLEGDEDRREFGEIDQDKRGVESAELGSGSVKVPTEKVNLTEDRRGLSEGLVESKQRSTKLDKEEVGSAAMERKDVEHKTTLSASQSSTEITAEDAMNDTNAKVQSDRDSKDGSSIRKSPPATSASTDPSGDPSAVQSLANTPKPQQGPPDKGSPVSSPSEGKRQSGIESPGGNESPLGRGTFEIKSPSKQSPSETVTSPPGTNTPPGKSANISDIVPSNKRSNEPFDAKKIDEASDNDGDIDDDIQDNKNERMSVLDVDQEVEERLDSSDHSIEEQLEVASGSDDDDIEKAIFSDMNLNPTRSLSLPSNHASLLSYAATKPSQSFSGRAEMSKTKIPIASGSKLHKSEIYKPTDYQFETKSSKPLTKHSDTYSLASKDGNDKLTEAQRSTGKKVEKQNRSTTKISDRYSDFDNDNHDHNFLRGNDDAAAADDDVARAFGLTSTLPNNEDRSDGDADLSERYLHRHSDSDEEQEDVVKAFTSYLSAKSEAYSDEDEDQTGTPLGFGNRNGGVTHTFSYEDSGSQDSQDSILHNLKRSLVESVELDDSPRYDIKTDRDLIREQPGIRRDFFKRSDQGNSRDRFEHNPKRSFVQSVELDESPRCDTRTDRNLPKGNHEITKTDLRRDSSKRSDKDHSRDSFEDSILSRSREKVSPNLSKDEAKRLDDSELVFELSNEDEEYLTVFAVQKHKQILDDEDPQTDMKKSLTEKPQNGNYSRSSTRDRESSNGERFTVDADETNSRKKIEMVDSDPRSYDKGNNLDGRKASLKRGHKIESPSNLEKARTVETNSRQAKYELNEERRRNITASAMQTNGNNSSEATNRTKQMFTSRKSWLIGTNQDNADEERQNEFKSGKYKAAEQAQKTSPRQDSEDISESFRGQYIDDYLAEAPPLESREITNRQKFQMLANEEEKSIPDEEYSDAQSESTGRRGSVEGPGEDISRACSSGDGESQRKLSDSNSNTYKHRRNSLDNVRANDARASVQSKIRSRFEEPDYGRFVGYGNPAGYRQVVDTVSHPRYYLLPFATIIANDDLSRKLRMLREKREYIIRRHLNARPRSPTGSQRRSASSNRVCVPHRYIDYDDEWLGECEAILKSSKSAVEEEKEKERASRILHDIQSRLNDLDLEGLVAKRKDGETAKKDKIRNEKKDAMVFEENLDLWRHLADEHRNYTKRLQEYQSKESRQASEIRQLKLQIAGLESRMSEYRRICDAAMNQLY